MKDKAFCLVEILVSITVLALGAILLSTVTTEISNYAVRTKLLLGAIDYGVNFLEKKDKRKLSSADFYTISVQPIQRAADSKLSQTEIVVAWHYHDRDEQIRFFTFNNKGNLS